MEPKFQIEFMYPRFGENLPALAIYLVDETSPLAIPKEVYRSENYGQSIVVLGKGVATAENAWNDATYCDATGYEGLEAEVRRAFKPSAMSSFGGLDEVVSGLVEHVRQQVNPEPGQYL